MTKQTNTQQASSKNGKSLIGRRLTLLLLCDDDAMISSPKKAPKMLLDMQTQLVGLVLEEFVSTCGVRMETKCLPNVFLVESEDEI